MRLDAAEVRIEVEIVAGQEFRREYDLAGVDGEMFHHVQDRFDHGHIVMLHPDPVGQAFGRLGADCSAGG